MRKSTLFLIVLSIFCSVSLFQTSQRTHAALEKNTFLEKEIAKEEESIRVLFAEWGYLNQPERLARLAREHLNLKPMKGTQFTTWEKIPQRTEALPPEENSSAIPKERSDRGISLAAPEKKDPSPVVRDDKKKAAKKETLKEKAAKPIVKAAPRPTQKTAPQEARTERKFGDVMKSLGVD